MEQVAWEKGLITKRHRDDIAHFILAAGEGEHIVTYTDVAVLVNDVQQYCHGSSVFYYEDPQNPNINILFDTVGGGEVQVWRGNTQFESLTIPWINEAELLQDTLDWLGTSEEACMKFKLKWVWDVDPKGNYKNLGSDYVKYAKDFA